MVFPELLSLALLDEFEERVAIGASLSERELPGDHREEKDADGKQVCRRAPVAVITLDNLRRHVPLCAYNAFLQAVAILTGDWSREAKVGNFEVEIFVEQQILGLQIAMGDAFKVAVVETFKQLLDVVARLWLGEGA